MTDTDTAVRMAELESRLAEQDRMIADLNEMVIAQWRKIDGLERKFGASSANCVTRWTQPP
ncbi:MAG: SlyX [Pseudomonadota bacterium]